MPARSLLYDRTLCDNDRIILVTHHGTAFTDGNTAVKHDVCQRCTGQDAAILHNDRILDLGILLNQYIAEQYRIDNLTLDVAAVCYQAITNLSLITIVSRCFIVNARNSSLRQSLSRMSMFAWK